MDRKIKSTAQAELNLTGKMARCMCVSMRRGTHLGEFDGIAPKGKALMGTGITIFHFADGKIVDDLFETSADLRQAILGSQ